MKKFRSAFVLYRDALVSHGDLVFDPAAPQEISVRVRLRGNALVSAAVHSAGGDAALPADALRIRGETLTFSRECFLSCACNAYAVVRLSFSRGQDARIPVYVAGPGGPPDVQRLFPLPGEADRSAAYRVRGGICFCLTAGEALGLPYDFTDADYGRTAVIKLGLPRPISIPRPRRVLIRLKGDGSYNALSLRLYNGCDASEYPLNEQYLDFEDERTLCFVLPETATLPLALCDALRLRYTPGCRKRKGELTVYEITASSEAACLPDAPPPPAYPLFAPPPPQPHRTPPKRLSAHPFAHDDVVLFVQHDHGGIDLPRLLLRHEREGHDRDHVADLAMMRRRPVQAERPFPRDARNRVGLQTRPVRAVHH